jgi:hypothetical protein
VRSSYNECMKMRGLLEGTDVLEVHYHSGSAKSCTTDNDPLVSMSRPIFLVIAAAAGTRGFFFFVFSFSLCRLHALTDSVLPSARMPSGTGLNSTLRQLRRRLPAKVLYVPGKKRAGGNDIRCMFGIAWNLNATNGRERGSEGRQEMTGRSRAGTFILPSSLRTC